MQWEMRTILDVNFKICIIIILTEFHKYFRKLVKVFRMTSLYGPVNVLRTV